MVQIKKNKGWKQLFVLSTTLLFFFFACSSDQAFIDNPVSGDIYIFEENEVFYPVMVDSISEKTIFCVNSRFKFVDAIPTLKDLPKHDFDFSFHLMYERDELKRLYESGQIIEVYRQ